MRELLAGAQLQLRLFRRNPAHLLIFITIPFFSAIFLSGMQQVHEELIAPYAVLGPALVGLWAVSLDLGGSIIDAERTQSTFELFVASPCSYSRVIMGRIATITVLGLLTFAEALLFATVAFGVRVHVWHPAVMVLTLAVTAVAMAGTSAAMAAIFVLARTARRFANALGYPFYILGGVVVPIAFLPAWLHPISWLTYLYWSANLLRDSLYRPSVAYLGWRLVAILGLGVLSYAIGVWFTSKVVDRLRTNGTIGLS